MRKHAGLSLIEFVVASAIMGLIAVAIGSVAMAVQRLASATSGVTETVQHSRAAQEYWSRTITRAHASLDFPGAVVWSESVDGDSFPETLIVWSPEGAVANPEGLPLFSELVMFTAHPQRPNELVMMENRGDTRVVPPLEDTLAWVAEIGRFKQDAAGEAVVLTPLLRVARLESAGLTNAERLRPALRFSVEQRPSREEFDAFEAGSLLWNELSWPLGLANSETGTVRVRCNVEWQLAVPDREADESLVFLDGASISFVIERPARNALVPPVLQATPTSGSLGP